MRKPWFAIGLGLVASTAFAGGASELPHARLAITAFQESSAFLAWEKEEKPACATDPSKAVVLESSRIAVFNGKVSGYEDFLVIASNGDCPGIFEQFYRRSAALVRVATYDEDKSGPFPVVSSISFPDLDLLYPRQR